MRSIVVGVHGRLPDPALALALDECLRRGLPLHAVHTYAIPECGALTESFSPARLETLRRDAETSVAHCLDAVSRRIPGSAAVEVITTVQPGAAAAALVSASETAALLVVGARGGGALVRGLRGSVSAACLHHARAPVAVVPATAHEPTGDRVRSRVVVGVDGTPSSHSALTWAGAQAREWGALLVPVVVCPMTGVPPPTMPDAASDVLGLLSLVLCEAGVGRDRVQPLVLVGQASDELLTVVRPDDMLVVGSRGRSAVPGLLLGSTSTAVAERARCPVVVVRAGQSRREVHERSLPPMVV